MSCINVRQTNIWNSFNNDIRNNHNIVHMKMRDDLPIKKYPLIPFKTEFSSTCDFRH